MEKTQQKFPFLLPSISLDSRCGGLGRRYHCTRAGAGAGAGEGVPQPGDGEVPEGKGVADDTVPIGNNEDHFVSAVAGNGQVVARAMTARNLVQVGGFTCAYCIHSSMHVALCT